MLLLDIWQCLNQFGADLLWGSGIATLASCFFQV